MNEQNPFPETPQKAYLRRQHLVALAAHKKEIGRKLGYLGLPSAKMLDVKVWEPLLDHITAVEREPSVAEEMYRTAQLMGIRQKTVIIEKNLLDVVSLLALKDDEIDQN